MDMENEKNPEEEKAGRNREDQGCVPTPPSPNQFELEQEWAEKLGMDFDPGQASSPPPVPEEERRREPEEPPMYVMPAEEYPGRPQYGQPAGTPDGVPTPDSMNPESMRPQPMPPTYMLWAVLTTICCCLPAGIVAIVFASSVSSKYFARDYEGARKASRNAEIWIIVSIVAGVIVNALYLPLTLLMPNGIG